MARNSTTILLISFFLIVLLAVLGILLGALLGVDDDIFHDAIRIIGIGGPAGTAGNAAAEALNKWRNNGTTTESQPVTGFKKK